MSGSTLDRAKAYATAYEGLTEDSIDNLCGLVASNVRFRDPFSEFSGRERMAAVFQRMFATLTAPRFRVSDIAVSNETAYLRWDFTFDYRRSSHRIDGMSEVHFGRDGLVTAHIDHWDASTQVYMKIPVLGWMIGRFRRRLAG